jgi:hypothetical protein
MNFDEYLLKGFDGLDDKGKSQDEKLRIIKNVLTALSNGEQDLETEREKFITMKNSGRDMEEVVEVMRALVNHISEQMFLNTFDDLVLLEETIAEAKANNKL